MLRLTSIGLFATLVVAAATRDAWATAGGTFVSAVARGPCAVGEDLKIDVVVRNTGTNWWDEWHINYQHIPGVLVVRLFTGDSVKPGETVAAVATCEAAFLKSTPGNHSISVYCVYFSPEARLAIPALMTVPYTLVSPQSPQIQTQPASQVVGAGADVALTVAATGSGQLSYQWSKDGAALSGQTQPTLKLLNVKAADAGLYTVLVSSPFGMKASEPALLTVVSVTPANWEIAANASGMEISLTVTGGELNWVVANPCASWITIAPMSGSGSSALSVTVSANGATTPRGCPLTIASQPFTVNQAGRTVPGVVHVNAAYLGGDADGSLERPYRKIADAYVAALSGDTICIFGTNYNEAITMSKPLLLQGTNGVVNIGIP